MMNFNVLVLVIAVVATSMVVPGAEGAKYAVGDRLGWTIPPGGAATYAAWVAKHHFVVNDVIGFKFTTGKDNLAWISFKEEFDNCNITNPAYVYNETVKIRFLGSATYYFTSTFPGHCLKGQKIAIYFAPSLTAPPNPRPNAAHDQADSAGLPLRVVSENLQGAKTSFSVINRSEGS